MVKKYRKGRNGLYVLSKEDIENEAEFLLNKYFKNCLDYSKPTPIELLIEKLGLNIEYKRISEHSEILGAFVFNEGSLEVFDNGKKEKYLFKEKTIIIDTVLVENDDVRLMFTYGHELGHFVTQYNLFHIDCNQLSLFDDKFEEMNAVVCNRSVVNSDTKKELISKEDWQEWQANYFSSCILIPRKTLKKALDKYLKDYDVMKHYAVLDKLDKSQLKELINELSKKYSVSIEMMTNRLRDLKYLSS